MFLLFQRGRIQTNLLQFLLFGSLFCFPFIQLGLLRLDKGFQLFLVFLGIFELFCNILMILTDLRCLMSQLILIAVDLTVIFLDLLCLFLKLFEVHLRGILLDVLSTELLLEFVYRVTEFISLFTVFKDRSLGRFQFFLTKCDVFFQLLDLTAAAEEIAVVTERTTGHGTARA